MKKILIYLLLTVVIYPEHNYNLSISSWSLSDRNKIDAFSMGSSLEFPIKDGLGYFGEVGSVYLNGKESYKNSGEKDKSTYYFDWGIYVEMGLKLRKKVKTQFNPYVYTSLRGTYFLSRFLQFNNIPGLKDEVLSYKLGTGMDFNDSWFIEYNFEIINNHKSEFTNKDKIYVNNLKLGMRAY